MHLFPDGNVVVQSRDPFTNTSSELPAVMKSTTKFRVVIAGGSVAGLTLAHCLLKNNIDFVVLEASPVVAPDVGASLGLLANGGRVLDQLGVFDDVQEEVVSIKDAFFWAADGSLNLKSNYPEELRKR